MSNKACVQDAVFTRSVIADPYNFLLIMWDLIDATIDAKQKVADSGDVIFNGVSLCFSLYVLLDRLLICTPCHILNKETTSCHESHSMHR